MSPNLRSGQTSVSLMSPNTSQVSALDSLRFGFIASIVASVSLPLYISLPLVYAGEFGLPVAQVGIILMLVRLLDGFTDPLFGRLIDRTKERRFQKWIIPASVLLTIAYGLVLNPPTSVLTKTSLLIYLAVFTLFVSLANGVISVAVHAWPPCWTSELPEQKKLVNRREQFTVIGVITATLLVTQSQNTLFISYLFCLTVIIYFAANNLPGQDGTSTARSRLQLSALAPLRWTLTYLFLNALANAVAATLFLFFVTDYLLFSKGAGGQLLIVYFIASLVGISLWSKIINRLQPKMTLSVSMTLSIIVFLSTIFLDSSNAPYFWVICFLNGLIVGAELICPSLIISLKLSKNGDLKENPSTVFGVWSLLTKLSLAVAAGLSLPAIGLYGYNPGVSKGSVVLLAAYVGIPCALKLASLALVILEKPYGKNSL